MSITCSQCGAGNPDDAFFCGSCGTKLRSSFDRASGPVEIDGDPNTPTLPPGQSDAAGLPPAPVVQLGPSPPAQQYAAPPPQPYVAPPPVPGVPQAQGYVPPQQSAAPGYASPAPGAYPAAQYGVPQAAPAFAPGANTSGMGVGYPVPREAEGWTFAGCIPYGLFSFFNGSTLWGILGIALNFVGLGLAYTIYIGIKGKELAWQGRRFDSVQQFVDTMRAWNNWGIFSMIAGIIFVILYFLFIFGVVMTGVMSEMANPPATTQ